MQRLYKTNVLITAAVVLCYAYSQNVLGCSIPIFVKARQWTRWVKINSSTVAVQLAASLNSSTRCLECQSSRALHHLRPPPPLALDYYRDGPGFTFTLVVPLHRRHHLLALMPPHPLRQQQLPLPLRTFLIW